MAAKQSPLIDLLKSVPQDARLIVEHDQFSSSSHPVGRLCHEAAAELLQMKEIITDETRDKIIEDAIKKNMTITDLKLYEAVYSVAMDAVAAEREACAKVCADDGMLWGARYVAKIRARVANV